MALVLEEMFQEPEPFMEELQKIPVSQKKEGWLDTCPGVVKGRAEANILSSRVRKLRTNPQDDTRQDHHSNPCQVSAHPDLASSLKIPFLETSAKSADNVEKAFLTMASEIHKRVASEGGGMQGDAKEARSQSAKINSAPLWLGGDKQTKESNNCC
ncbi:uncharacterized protein [Labrus bergylta]|uniref:uncharacterized protein n=1 Tax=Labrus bergylta TaxID=56723 RepID=UPI0033134404